MLLAIHRERSAIPRRTSSWGFWWGILPPALQWGNGWSSEIWQQSCPHPQGNPSMSCLVNVSPANPVRGFPLLLVALEWAINALLPYWRVLGTANWGGDCKMSVMYPMSPFFPSFYFLFSFDFHFPLSRSLFSGHLTSCKPSLGSGVKGSSQTNSSGLWTFHSWHQKSCRGSLGPNSSSHTWVPHQHGVWGLTLGVHLDLNSPV